MKSNYLSRKESILITSIQIFDEMGIKGLTTKEIARREGISEPAVYRHYSGKKSIVMAIISEFSRFDKQLFMTIIENKFGAVDSIDYFCESLLTYYFSYPEVITIVFSLDAFRYDDETQVIMNNIILKRVQFLCNLIEKGKDGKEFRKDFSSLVFARRIYGTLMSELWLWKLSDKKDDIKHEIIESVKMHIDIMKP